MYLARCIWLLIFSYFVTGAHLFNYLFNDRRMHILICLSIYLFIYRCVLTLIYLSIYLFSYHRVPTFIYLVSYRRMNILIYLFVNAA